MVVGPIIVDSLVFCLIVCVADVMIFLVCGCGIWCRLESPSLTVGNLTVEIADFNADSCVDVVMSVYQDSNVLMYDGATALTSPTVRVAAHRTIVSQRMLTPLVAAAGAVWQ